MSSAASSGGELLTTVAEGLLASLGDSALALSTARDLLGDERLTEAEARTRLEEMVAGDEGCSACGHELEEGRAECSNCGHVAEADSAADAPAVLPDLKKRPRAKRRRRKKGKVADQLGVGESQLEEREFSAGKRKELAAKGHALPDGSYPIEKPVDVRNAERLAKSGHGDVAGAKRLIRRRAKELGVRHTLDEYAVVGGTETPYGGATPAAAAQSPYTGDAGLDVPYVASQPPNLRESDDWAACGNCIFYGKGQCNLYGLGRRGDRADIVHAGGWPVDEADLCDSHSTLTPRAARLDEARAQLAEALASGSGDRIVRARARVRALEEWSYRGSLANVGGKGIRPLDADVLRAGGVKPPSLFGKWSEAKHPRQRGGEFAHTISKLKPGEMRALASGVQVHNDTQHGYSVLHHGEVISRHGNDAAAAARTVKEVADRDAARRALPTAERRRRRDAALGLRASESGAQEIRAQLEEIKSDAYPGLDRSPKQNWVDKAGGLPRYIERIAKHLHYEKGKPIGTAIAIAVNVVKKMCASGDTNFPGKQSVNPKSRAEACAAVAQWERKKGATSARGRAGNLARSPLQHADRDPEWFPDTFEEAEALYETAYKPIPPSWPFIKKLHEEIARRDGPQWMVGYELLDEADALKRRYPDAELFIDEAKLSFRIPGMSSGKWNPLKHPRAAKGRRGGGEFAKVLGKLDQDARGLHPRARAELPDARGYRHPDGTTHTERLVAEMLSGAGPGSAIHPSERRHLASYLRKSGKADPAVLRKLESGGGSALSAEDAAALRRVVRGEGVSHSVYKGGPTPDAKTMRPEERARVRDSNRPPGGRANPPVGGAGRGRAAAQIPKRGVLERLSAPELADLHQKVFGGERPPDRLIGRGGELSMVEKLDRARPFRATHEYHPGLMDRFDANVIEGRAIEPGSPVRIVSRGKGVDPLGKIVHIEDEHRNRQSVWKAALLRPGEVGRRNPPIKDDHGPFVDQMSGKKGTTGGGLPPVSELKNLSDDEVKRLVGRIIPQSAPFKGEAWPESDPAFKDYPRRIAEEANRRARRRYSEDPTGGGGRKNQPIGDSRDLPSLLTGLGPGKHEITVGGVPFTLYYDERGAVGDSGGRVAGDKTGEWEVFRGHGGPVGLGRAVARVHVSPHGTSGYGNAAAPRHAAEEVARAIHSEVKRRSGRREQAMADDSGLSIDHAIGSVLQTHGENLKDWHVSGPKPVGGKKTWVLDVETKDGGKHSIHVHEDGSVHEPGSEAPHPLHSAAAQKTPHQVAGELVPTGETEKPYHMPDGQYFRGKDGLLYQKLESGPHLMMGKKGPLAGVRIRNHTHGTEKVAPAFALRDYYDLLGTPAEAKNPPPHHVPSPHAHGGDDVLELLQKSVAQHGGEGVGSLSGKHVVVTGAIPGMTREEFHAKLKAAGAIPHSSVSNKVDYLITGANVGKTKTQAAEKKGVKVVPHHSILHLLEAAPSAEDWLHATRLAIAEADSGSEVARLRARERVFLRRAS